jgi:predicted 3-demethylubiquinone-9 3-methyltransferase (glyoxalase superfamily)
VLCRTQKEIDGLWGKLKRGGKELQCGWVTDRFGLTWQVVPQVLPKLLGSGGESGARVHEAMMKMVKLDIAKLQRAAAKA